jgi:ACS family glucarate transporter-like MFS transporter
LNSRGVGAVRWSLVGWLFVLSTIAYLDRVNIAVAGQSIAREYHLSNVQLGWLSSALLLGYAAFQAPGGRAADRLGARRILTVAVIWWGVFSAAMALVPVAGSAIIVMAVLRFALGSGEAVMYPAANRIVAAWIPVRERGLANGLIFMGTGIGSGITPPIVTALLVHYGWRASFIVCAVIGVCAGAVWFVLARDTPAAHPRVSADERVYIEAAIPARVAAAPLAWRTICGDRNVRLLTLSYFCYGYLAWIFLAWFFIYLRTARGMDLSTTARYAMLPGIGMALGSGGGGILNDMLSHRYGRRVGRCGVAALGIGLAAVFIALGTQAEGARIASITLAAGAGCLYLAQSSFWSVSADIAGSSAGAVSGVMNMGAQLGGVVTASLTPWIAGRFGWTSSFLVAAVLCVLGASAWAFVRPNEAIESTTGAYPTVP